MPASKMLLKPSAPLKTSLSPLVLKGPQMASTEMRPLGSEVPHWVLFSGTPQVQRQAWGKSSSPERFFSPSRLQLGRRCRGAAASPHPQAGPWPCASGTLCALCLGSDAEPTGKALGPDRLASASPAFGGREARWDGVIATLQRRPTHPRGRGEERPGWVGGGRCAFVSLGEALC